MAKVYLVTSGSYSDYHIEAAFSTEELAEAYKKRWGDSYDSYVEEWDLDPVDPHQHPNLSFFQVQMWRNGDTLQCKSASPLSAEEDRIASPAWKGRMPLLITYCWARDKKHAVKIANEKRTQAIAEGRMNVGKNDE